MTDEQQSLRDAANARLAQMHLALVGAKTLMDDEYLYEALVSACVDFQVAALKYIEDLEASLGIKRVMDTINQSADKSPF